MARGGKAGWLQGGVRVILFDRTWRLPDGETHLVNWMLNRNQRVDGRLTYQYHKYEAARDQCKQRHVALDIGAHVGLWSYWMARDFQKLIAFEPKPSHVECWHANMAAYDNAILHEVALGNERRKIGLKTGPSSSGDTSVDLSASDVPMCKLDDYKLRDVDLIKIDCEGYEAFVLEGARETLTRCKPVLIVEQKPGHGQRYGRGEHDAVTLLEAMGATMVWEYAGDYVLTFEKAA